MNKGATPVRHQRRRTAGYQLPANCKSVTRPGRYGNPFVVGAPADYRYTFGADKIYDFDDIWPLIGEARLKYPAWSCYYEEQHITPEIAVALFEALMKLVEAQDPAFYMQMVNDLRGYDLACFCRLDAPCHVDVLLKIVNAL